MNPKETTVYVCSLCGMRYDDEGLAASCCSCVCGKCGEPIDKRGARWVLCDRCQHEENERSERSKWEKLPRIKASEFTGPVYYDSRFFFGGQGELLDSMECEGNPAPEWGALTTERMLNGLCADYLVDYLEDNDNSSEDYEVSDAARRAIDEFCEEWNRKYAEWTYFPGSVAVAFVPDGENAEKEVA